MSEHKLARDESARFEIVTRVSAIKSHGAAWVRRQISSAQQEGVVIDGSSLEGVFNEYEHVEKKASTREERCVLNNGNPEYVETGFHAIFSAR